MKLRGVILSPPQRASVEMHSADGLVISFARTPAIHRVIDATTANVHAPSIPGEDTARSVAQTLNDSPLARVAAARLLKIGVGAAGGAYLAHRAGGSRRAIRRGAVSGAIAGAMLGSTETIMSLERNLARLVSRHAAPVRPGVRESHTLESLAARVLLPVEFCCDALAAGIIRAENEVARGNEDGPAVYSSNHLNEVRAAVLSQIAEDVARATNGTAAAIESACGRAVREHVKFFENPKKTTTMTRTLGSAAVMLSREEDHYTAADRLAKVGAVIGTGALLVGGAGYVRGRAALGASRQSLGALATSRLGLRLLRDDASKLGQRFAGALRAR